MNMEDNSPQRLIRHYIVLDDFENFKKILEKTSDYTVNIFEDLCKLQRKEYIFYVFTTNYLKKECLFLYVRALLFIDDVDTIIQVLNKKSDMFQYFIKGLRNYVWTCINKDNINKYNLILDELIKKTNIEKLLELGLKI